MKFLSEAREYKYFGLISMLQAHVSFQGRLKRKFLLAFFTIVSICTMGSISVTFQMDYFWKRHLTSFTFKRFGMLQFHVFFQGWLLRKGLVAMSTFVSIFEMSSFSVTFQLAFLKKRHFTSITVVRFYFEMNCFVIIVS